MSAGSYHAIKTPSFNVDYELHGYYDSHTADEHPRKSQSFHSVESMVRRYVRSACMVVLVVALIASGVGIVFYRAAQHEPAFYRQAMQIRPEQQAEAGDKLEQGVLELRNEARDPGRWEAIFTEDQINGWLAADLPDKFPGTLPEGVESPRVAIRDGQVHIAARYQDKVMSSVVSIALDICLTEEVNTIAVTIKRIRAGALPVPVRQFLDRISRTAEKGDIPLRWSQAEGDPVALVTIPSRRDDYAHREIFIETIEFRDGEIYLAGRTDALSTNSTPVAQRSGSGGVGENVTFQR